jgi:hypothetical protein
VLLQAAEVAGEDGKLGRGRRVGPPELMERIPDPAETVGVRCTQREDRGGEELAPVRMKYGHRDPRTSRTHRARSTHAFSTASRTREDGGWRKSTGTSR